MLLRSIRTVEHLRRISASSVSAYLTSPSLVTRALPTESALSSPISRFYYSNPRNENRHTTTTSSPVSSRWRISIRHMSRRRNSAKGSAATAGSAAYSSAVDLAMDSVVKIFTVSTSPSYFLPWQNKSQRESMGSGNTLSLLKIITFCLVWFLVCCFNFEWL